MAKFGIGQAVPRAEDPRLLTGGGQYTDDVSMPGQAVGYVLRSPHAHAEIRAIDLADASQSPGRRAEAIRILALATFPEIVNCG